MFDTATLIDHFLIEKNNFISIAINSIHHH